MLSFVPILFGWMNGITPFPSHFISSSRMRSRLRLRQELCGWHRGRGQLFKAKAEARWRCRTIKAESFEVLSPNSIMPTLWQSGTSSRQSRGHKSWKSMTQIMSPTFMICVRNFVGNLLWTLSPTFPVHCNESNSIRVTQTGLSQTCHGLCRKHLDFPRKEVLVKVGVIEFGL